MSKLKVKIGKLVLKNPVILASGTFDRSIAKKVNVDTLGGVVTKTITLEPRQGNPLPHIYKTKYGWLNSVGWKNVGLKKYLSEELPFWQQYDSQIIPSVGGSTVQEFLKISKALAKEKVNAIELDVSCPTCKNIEGDLMLMAEITNKVKKVFSQRTVIVKLPPDTTGITKTADLILRAGADVLTVANTYPALELRNGKPVFKKIIGGYSGGPIRPITLAMVWRVYQKFKCPIIASGGIETAQDALDYMTAGAKAVQIGSASFLNPKVSVKIVGELEQKL